MSATDAHNDDNDDGLDDDDSTDPRRAAKRSRQIWAVLLAVAAGGWVAYGLQGHALHKQIRELQAANQSVEIRAPASMQTYVLTPALGGLPANPTLSLGWPNPPQLLELHIDATEMNFNAFQITVEKIGAARLLQLRRVIKDSNRQLQLALNSSAFGPGDYSMRLEGYTWRGDLVDAGWIRLSLR